MHYCRQKMGWPTLWAIFLQKMGWPTLWAIFLQTHRVTLCRIHFAEKPAKTVLENRTPQIQSGANVMNSDFFVATIGMCI
jgi:hypothetical protein